MRQYMMHVVLINRCSQQPDDGSLKARRCWSVDQTVLGHFLPVRSLKNDLSDIFEEFLEGHNVLLMGSSAVDVHQREFFEKRLNCGSGH